MGSGRVHKHIRQHNDAWAHIDTGIVPGYIWGPVWCPGTYVNQNGAWAHMGTGRVPGLK